MSMMDDDDDVFVLPEFDASDSNSGDMDVIELGDDDENDVSYGDEPDNNGILNTTVLSEVTTSNHCDSVTSYESTSIMTIDNSSEGSEDEDDIIFETERHTSFDTDSQTSIDTITTNQSEDSIIKDDKTSRENNKGSKENSNDRKIFRYSAEKVDLKCEWMSGDGVVCDYPSTWDRFEFSRHIHKHCLEIQSDGADVVVPCRWKGCGVSLKPTEVMFHVNYHGYHSALKCCGENAMTRNNFQKCAFPTENVNKIDLKETYRTCEWNGCGKHFVNMFAFESHVYNHTQERFANRTNGSKEKVPCEWNYCIQKPVYSKEKRRFITPPTFSVDRSGLLYRHILKHTGLKRLACPTCGTVFKTRFEFKTHCDRRKKNVNLQCYLCMKYFKSNYTLKFHIKRHVYSKKCSFCDVTCINTHTLANHIKFMHMKETPYECKQCDYKAKTINQLKQHEIVHIEKSERPKIKCTYPSCTFETVVRRTYYNHINSVHKKVIYACHICENRYKRATVLSKHLREIHNIAIDRFRFRMSKSDGFYRLQLEHYEETVSSDDENEENNATETELAPPPTDQQFSLEISHNNGGMAQVKIHITK